MSGYDGRPASNDESDQQVGFGASSAAAVGTDTRAGAATITPAPSAGSRALSCVLALLVGAVFGAVGTVAHQSTLNLGMFRLPFGLPLALLGVIALLVGFRLLFVDRLIVLLAAIGVVGVIALFSIPSPGGAVLIPQGLAGIVWTIGPVLLATVVVAWPRLPDRSATPDRGVRSA